MRKLLFSLLFVCLCHVPVFPQNTIFDDTRLGSIYIAIPADSLAVIYDSVLSDHYYMARFIFDDNVNKDTLENIGFRLRGNTSRYAQKKSFKISFNEYVPGRKYQGVKKINLNGEHNDPTMIREKLYYDIWKKAGMVERRTCFVKVFINQTYYGLYTNLEEMEKEWLTRIYPEAGGNLYKCSYPADLVYLGTDQQVYKDLENSTATGGRVYELQTNKSPDDYTRLVELISKLNNPAGEQFATAISKILNVNLFLKSLALDVATGNWDDYSYNRNNFYLYDNPADSLFHFITYDPDNTFGVDWFGIDWGTRDCRDWINREISLPLAQKLLAVPAFYDTYKMFLDTIARSVINPDSIFNRIDSLKQLIFQAAVDDTYRTLDYGYTVGDFNDGFVKAVDSHTPYGIKPFLETRKQSILDQINAWGISNNAAGTTGIQVFPNPATDNIICILSCTMIHSAKVKVTDIFGRTTLEYAIPGNKSNQLAVPVQTLAPGLYLLRVESGGRFFQEKFIKK
jgi:hypothetical protein